MAINFSNGGSAGITRAPRAIFTGDGVAGCPPTRACGTRIAESVFTTTSDCVILAQAIIIRRLSNTNCDGVQRDGRCDMQLQGAFSGASSGQQLDRTLDYNDGDTGNWQEAVMGWMGTVSAGSHSIFMSSDTCRGWGCEGTWGHVQVYIFE